MPVVPPLGMAKTVNAAAYNRLRKAAIQDPTPGTPERGMVRFNNGELEVYYGATTGWQKPWSQPWGIMDIQSVSSSQGSITTITDLTGTGSVAWTAVANRRVIIQGIVLFSSTVATDEASLVIADGGGTTLHAASVPLPKAGNNYTCIDTMFVTPAAGAASYKLRAQRVTGSTGTITMVASATVPAWLIATDIGSNGAAPAS